MLVVSIEGIDGTGKTTLLEGLKRELGTEEYCFVSFPTDTFYQKYRELDKNEMTEEEYYTAVNRLQTKDKEETYKAKEELGNKIMFCDRYELSQKVYDGKRLGNIEAKKESDFIIYLSIEPGEVIERIEKRGVEDALGYEDEKVLKEMKQRFESILGKDYKGRNITIEAQQGPEEILKRALGILKVAGYVS